MVRENRIETTFPQDVIIAASVAAIGFSIWSRFSDGATHCQKVLEKPLLILAVFLLVFSVMILVGRFCHICMFISITFRILVYLVYLGLFCLSVFSVLVTNRNVSRALYGRGGNYSHYLLKKFVVNEEYWEHIKGCFVAYRFCQRTQKPVYFYTQSSCCKPPTYCGFEFHNATYWTIPKAGPAIADGDCKIWSNVQNDLCFNCQSCRTKILNLIQGGWKMYSLVYLITFLTVHLLYCVICCVTWKKNRSKGYQCPKVYPA
ncbi:tetraspanin-8-like [Capsicum annuum]|uniref:tetraspanin-8-like n=1 Tax=Capsicum annuum TaxID=4072 RepID=UPI0007BFE6D1|nr:tetraspanin-8-like [Capsicum annuum]